MDLVVGRVVKAHGITGEVVVEIRTDDPDTRFAPGSPCAAGHLAAAPRVATSSSRSREHGGRLLVRLDGVADRNAAESLRGTVFVVDSEDLPPIEDPDEFYDHQLEGLQVVTTDGRDRRHRRRGIAHRGRRIAFGASPRTARCWCRSSAPS